MTLTFAVAGACEVITGLALRPAAAPGRLILMAGGVAGVLVAANPQHAGGSLAHAVWAVAGLSALTAWPGAAWRRGPTVPWGLRPAVSVSAAAILLGLLAWFCAELVAGGGQVGLAERVMGVAQASWPLAVTLSCGLASPAPGCQLQVLLAELCALCQDLPPPGRCQAVRGDGGEEGCHVLHRSRQSRPQY